VFHRHGPADAEHRSPKVLLECRTTHITVSVIKSKLADEEKLRSISDLIVLG